MGAFYLLSESCFALQIRLGDPGEATRLAHSMISALTQLQPEYGRSVVAKRLVVFRMHLEILAARTVGMFGELGSFCLMWVAGPLLFGNSRFDPQRGGVPWFYGSRSVF